MTDKVLNLGQDAAQEPAFVSKTTDPVILPQPYSAPADFAAQYPQPLDPTEIIAMCDEVSLWQALPERRTMLNGETWRELNSLAFTSGSSYVSFATGECPEEYTHDGTNYTVNSKNIGAKKSLAINDIMHSAAVAGANWHGINRLVGPVGSAEGLPGSAGTSTIGNQTVMDVKAKEMALAGTLVLNGWDRLLVQGNATSNSLEFDGVENWQTNMSVSFHTNDNTSSGTFSAISFDRFLSESCATPTQLWGHPQAIQELMSAYFQLGYQGSQLVNFNDGNRLTPGFNFSSRVNTGVGTLGVVSDTNFRRTAAGATALQVDIWAMRMTQNGEPLVYKQTQIPFGVNDLVPGCTAISFQVWAKTALIIKHACAHGQYTTQITGRSTTTCPTIG